MIEWLITDYHFIPTFFVISLILVSVLFAIIMSRSAFADSFKISEFAMIALLDLILSSMIMILASLTINLFITTKPVGSAEWKTIYSNDRDIKVKVSFRLSSVEAGDTIGERFADVFSNLLDYQSKTVSITASKSDYAKSKDFELSKENLISNGDIDKTSKIVKVEIRNADYVETNLFGFKGSNRYMEHKEVRITLDNDTTVQQEVNKLFE